MPDTAPQSPQQLMADIQALASQLRRAAKKLPQPEYEAVANKALYNMASRAYQAGLICGQSPAVTRLPEHKVLAGARA